jgi:enterochelin esterase-like enzyme
MGVARGELTAVILVCTRRALGYKPAMRSTLILPLAVATALTTFAADKKGPSPDDQYKKLTPDSLEQPGVPKGTVTEHEWNNSKVYPGTIRKYWVYVPKQYTAAKPACVFVCQDGLKYNATTVFDNLIAKKEMPVTIGIFINPGNKPLKPGEPPRKKADGKPAPPANRSVEYDSLGDTYAKFLLEEILPEVAKKYNLTQDPAGRCIAGSSSGGICAWTVCWERPDALAASRTSAAATNTPSSSAPQRRSPSASSNRTARTTSSTSLARGPRPTRPWPRRSMKKATTTNSSSARASTAPTTARSFSPRPCAGCGATGRNSLNSPNGTCIYGLQRDFSCQENTFPDNGNDFSSRWKEISCQEK